LTGEYKKYTALYNFEDFTGWRKLVYLKKAINPSMFSWLTTNN
jgi:hypothetical protein